MTSFYSSGDGEEGLGFAPAKELRYDLLSTVLIRAADYESNYADVQVPPHRSATLSDLVTHISGLSEPVTWTYDSHDRGAGYNPRSSGKGNSTKAGKK